MFQTTQASLKPVPLGLGIQHFVFSGCCNVMMMIVVDVHGGTGHLHKYHCEFYEFNENECENIK